MPLAWVMSANPPLPRLRNSGKVSFSRVAVVVQVAEIEAHAGDELAVVGERHAGFESDLLELPAALVVE